MVFQMVGHVGLETEAEVEFLGSLCSSPRLCINFFHPVLDLAFKGRVNVKFLKNYDQVLTPQQLIMARAYLSLEIKGQFTNACMLN